MIRPMIAVGVLLLVSRLAAEEEPILSPPVTDEHGIVDHQVQSEFQGDTTHIRVLLPDRIDADQKYPAVYVLPVEARSANRYGDGLWEVKQRDLHNRHQAVFVAPTFAQIPWYADHPTDKEIRQETYLLRVVLPLVERTYPVQSQLEGRLLVGFSKSGFGAWTLLLRNPDVFGRAAAWDAPLMMDRLGKYGTAGVFGTPENFDNYGIAHLLRTRRELFAGQRRLVLLGYGNFREHHQQAHVLLNELKIPHTYRDGPERTHDWYSGWLPEAVELLLTASTD